MACGCNDNDNLNQVDNLNQDDSLNQIQVNQVDDPLPIDVLACTDTFSRVVREFAEISIIPTVVPGTISVICLGNPRFVDAIPTGTMTQCNFFVEQDVCVQVDILFGASVTVPTVAAICEPATLGACVTPTPGFTCCGQAIHAEMATFEGERLTRFEVDICAPPAVCSPVGSSINVEFPAGVLGGAHFEIDTREISSVTCMDITCDNGLPGTEVTVLASSIFNGGPGNTTDANFTFVFNSCNDTVTINATAVGTGEPLLTNVVLVISSPAPGGPIQPCNPTPGG